MCVRERVRERERKARKRASTRARNVLQSGICREDKSCCKGSSFDLETTTTFFCLRLCETEFGGKEKMLLEFVVCGRIFKEHNSTASSCAVCCSCSSLKRVKFFEY